MNGRHTPGPWFADMWTDDLAGAVGWTIGAGHPSYRVPTSTFETNDEEEAEANARLMAAAPDLLEALEALLRRVKVGYDGLPQGHGVRIAEAAIAKATIKSPGFPAPGAGHGGDA